jgi:hypothetical protein
VCQARSSTSSVSTAPQPCAQYVQHYAASSRSRAGDVPSPAGLGGSRDAAARPALEDRIEPPAGAGDREGAPPILPVCSRRELLEGLAIVAIVLAVAGMPGR